MSIEDKLREELNEMLTGIYESEMEEEIVANEQRLELLSMTMPEIEAKYGNQS